MMAENGQFSWLDNDDLSAQNRIQIETVKKREGLKNDATRKLRAKAQDNEQTAINRHAEGRCWGCGEQNKIMSTIYNSCEDCIDKKGFESLLTIMGKKMNHELCDFCAEWKIGSESS